MLSAFDLRWLASLAAGLLRLLCTVLGLVSPFHTAVGFSQVVCGEKVCVGFVPPGGKMKAPVRFVYRDDEGTFRVTPEAVELLGGLTCPVAVVGVCGVVRQGKSSVLNLLLRQLGGGGGFPVSASMDACTKGLWLAVAPEVAVSMGVEYRVVLVDMEGVDAGDADEDYTCRLFALCVLLSTLLLLNQSGKITESCLRQLSVVSDFCALIRRQSQPPPGLQEDSSGPSLFWLLRDFSLEFGPDETPTSYMDKMLEDVPPTGRRASEIDHANDVRRSIRDLFPRRRCFTLVRPSESESGLKLLDKLPFSGLRREFQEDFCALLSAIREEAKPPTVADVMLTGPLLLNLALSFADAATNGTFPDFGQAWQLASEQLCNTARGGALAVYEEAMGPLPATLDKVYADQLPQLHADAVNEAWGWFKERVRASPALLEEHHEQLVADLGGRFQERIKSVEQACCGTEQKARDGKLGDVVVSATSAAAGGLLGGAAAVGASIAALEGLSVIGYAMAVSSTATLASTVAAPAIIVGGGVGIAAAGVTFFLGKCIQKAVQMMS